METESSIFSYIIFVFFYIYLYIIFVLPPILSCHSLVSHSEVRGSEVRPYLEVSLEQVNK